MAKYVFPAIFTKEDDGQYSIDFPDIPCCSTCGTDLNHALFMAEDVLAFTLSNMEKRNEEIKKPSATENIKLDKNEFVNLIHCDTGRYEKEQNKAVKKTLSIPKWLNDEALSHKINFSQVLQEALIERVR